LSRRTIGGLHRELLTVPGRHRHAGQIGLQQRAGLAGDQPSHRIGVIALHDRGADGVQRVQALHPRLQLLVQVGVLHRHPSLGRQDHQRLLVVGVEGSRSLLLGQVDVAENPVGRGNPDSRREQAFRTIRRCSSCSG
jgi:hypothetical protein